MDKGPDKDSGVEEWRSITFVWKLMTKIERSKVKMNSYPERRDWRRKCLSKI